VVWCGVVWCQNAANLMNIRYNMNVEDLYVAEAIVTRGHIQKGIMIHGRGEGGT
jgi:ribosomal protein L22